MVTARWAWRDLRHHLVQIASIGLVVAIGTGIFTGLGSTGRWRTLSNDASFAALHLHDVRVALQLGTFAPAGSLLAAARSISHATDLTAASERLVVDTQVDASAEGHTVLVGARLVAAAGLASGRAEPTVDTVWLANGDRPVPGEDAGLLEAKFARYYGLATSGTVTLAGGTPVPYTGLGIAPEDFSVVAQQGSALAEADLATLYVDLATAQRLVGRPGMVNDLVVTLREGTDRTVVAAELAAAVSALGVVSPAVTTRDDTAAYRMLYDDIATDQQMWNILSALVLIAAALAAVNLISRVVETQRRDIGIGMALGLPRWRLAVRPALIGAEVAVIGTVAGVGVGVLVGSLMRNLLESLLPLPIYRTPFQYGVYLRGLAIGILPPLVAAVVPVWRAVRVEPAEAIRTGHLAPRGGRLGRWSARIRLPGSSLVQMPLRNTLRAPRRTVLTALGVGATISALVGVMGLLDSFDATVDRSVAEVTRGDADRVTITLDGLVSRVDPTVAAIAASPVVGALSAGLRVPVTAHRPGATAEPLDLVVEVIDFDTALWTPSTDDMPRAEARRGLVLARKAAADLGVGVGDEVVVTHPRLVDGRYEMVDTTLTVTALHPDPIRGLAYLDRQAAATFGLADAVNTLQAVPAEGHDRSELQRAVFGVPGVASAQPVTRLGEVFDEVLRRFTGFLAIIAGSVLALGVLIGVNATRISVEERRRDHATMRAFGVPVWVVVAHVVTEAALVGVVATAVGLAAGSALLRWLLDTIARRTLPEVGVVLELGGSTMWIAAGVGVAALSLAPLLLVRRITALQVPDTLRLVE